MFRVGSLREWTNFVLWLFYLFIILNVHTVYAAFLLICALLFVGFLYLAWRKKPATSTGKRLFLWVPVPVSAFLLAMLVAKITPYALRTERRGAVSVRVDRWSGCSSMRSAGSSEEWGNLDCPNADHNWLSEFTKAEEQSRENNAQSVWASTPTPPTQLAPPIFPAGREVANSAPKKPVDLLAGEFIITRGSLADQNGWRKVTIGVDTIGDLYIVNNEKYTKWNPETETWAFGDPVAWTNARDLISERPVVVRAMCKRHVDVWVFDEILTDQNGRIVHASTEPACRLVGDLNASGTTAASPVVAKPPTPSGIVRSYYQPQGSQSMPPATLRENLCGDETKNSFTAKSGNAIYEFFCAEGAQSNLYFMGTLDTDTHEYEGGPDFEEYLLQGKAKNRGTFIFDPGEYEALTAEQKASVQAFCQERIRILRKAGVDEQYWKQGGWYELDTPGAAGKLVPVCN
jgi:hypothetical protein